MTEHDIGKMITCTIDSMPVPWEKLWTVFRKILQLTQRENENNIIQKEENSEVETTGEEERDAVNVEVKYQIMQIFAGTVEVLPETI